MGTLTITFQGICTHFRGFVPGVPHRVVLPDASAFRYGLLEFADSDAEPITYFLPPHVALLRDTTDPEAVAGLTVKGAIHDGNIFNGVRLQVVNAADDSLEYHAYKPHGLRPFMEEYVPSADVVLGGRAVCYFDIFNGSVHMQQKSSGELNVVAKFKTNGPPELLVTPFFQTEMPDPDKVQITRTMQKWPVGHRLPLKDGTHLTLSNIGLACGNDLQFDFLLHYLTAQGGIPRVLKGPLLPGMINPQPIQTADLDQAIEQLRNFNFPYGTNVLVETAIQAKEQFPLLDVTASCSNSGYP